jgi:hypothetical protein
VIVSLAVLLLLGVLVYLLIRHTKLRAWQAAVCIVFGFYLAVSPATPYLRAAAVGLGHLLSGLGS